MTDLVAIFLLLLAVLVVFETRRHRNGHQVKLPANTAQELTAELYVLKQSVDQLVHRVDALEGRPRPVIPPPASECEP